MLASEAVTALKDRLSLLWTVAQPTIPIVYTNAQRPTFDENSRILHVEVRFGAQQVVGFKSVGNNRYRQSGEVIIRIFGPSDVGEDEARGYADTLSGILRGYRVSDLLVTSCAPASGAASDEDGNWYELDVLASFFYDLEG